MDHTLYPKCSVVHVILVFRSFSIKNWWLSKPPIQWSMKRRETPQNAPKHAGAFRGQETELRGMAVAWTLHFTETKWLLSFFYHSYGHLSVISTEITHL